MISYFDKVKSLRNLGSGHASGQVATFLILIITAMLIFVLAVANVGQVSNYATSLSNAADAASMLLASLVGTKSFQLSGSLMESCGRPHKCCVKTGFLYLILAIILAIVAIVVTILTWGTSGYLLAWAGENLAACVAAGAIGGAIGGGIGGAIAGTGWLQGALMGAAVGAAIGAGISAGAAIVGDAFAVPATNLVTWNVGATAGTAAATIVVPITTMVPSAAGAIVGASLGATLAIASNIYTAYVKDQMRGDAMVSATKAMNGLPDEKTRRRENVFFRAFADTIDDPNKVVDTNDSDGDGNVTEYVPNFQACWDRRITWIKENNRLNTTQQSRLVRQFLNGPLPTFMTAVDTFLFAIDYENRSYCPCDDYGNCDGYGNPSGCCATTDSIPVAGGLIGLFSALEGAGYPISFWVPGPTQAQLDAWYNWDPFSCGGCRRTNATCGTVWNPLNQCTACEPPDPPSGYDEVDYVKQDLLDFKITAGYILQMDEDDLAYSWQLWVPWFYVPDSEIVPPALPADYYHTLYLMVNGDNSSIPVRAGLRNWLVEIERIRQRLPTCNYGTGGWYSDEYGNPGNLSWSCVAPGEPCNDCIIASVDPETGRPNPPCQWHPDNPNFGSTDTDIDDEFAMARDRINTFIDAVEAFRQACRRLYEGLSALGVIIEPPNSPMSCGLYGGNPAFYTWTDSRGEHTIWVQIGPYNEPRLTKRKYGNWLKGKECIELDFHTQNVSVEIVRQEPAENAGILGLWNFPAGSTIRRRSVAEYRGLKSYDDRCRPAGWVKIIGR